MPKRRGRPPGSKKTIHKEPKEKPGRGRKKIPFEQYIRESNESILQWEAELNHRHASEHQGIKNKIAALKSRVAQRRAYEDMTTTLNRGEDQFNAVFEVLERALNNIGKKEQCQNRVYNCQN